MSLILGEHALFLYRFPVATVSEDIGGSLLNIKTHLSHQNQLREVGAIWSLGWRR